MEAGFAAGASLQFQQCRLVQQCFGVVDMGAECFYEERRQVQPSNTNFERPAFIPGHIRAFARAQNMHLTQIKCQRLLGPRFSDPIDVVPGSECEIFVCRLPRHITEPELLPFFEQIGPVYQIRLMMNLSTSNKGYCFIKYFTPEHADQAVAQLHHSRLTHRSHKIVCNKSVANARLILAGVPTYKLQNEIEAELKTLMPGVKNVETMWNPRLAYSNFLKGIIIVTYETHRYAALARKLMLETSLYLWGYPITVDWAPIPPSVVLPNGLPKRKAEVLQVSNLPPTIPVESIAEKFNEESCGGVYCIVKHPTHAFLYMATRAHAEMAKNYLDGSIFFGSRISVGWFDPSLEKEIFGTSGKGGRFYQGRFRREQQNSSNLPTDARGDVVPTNFSTGEQPTTGGDNFVLPRYHPYYGLSSNVFGYDPTNQENTVPVSINAFHQ